VRELRSDAHHRMRATHAVARPLILSANIHAALQAVRVSRSVDLSYKWLHRSAVCEGPAGRRSAGRDSRAWMGRGIVLASDSGETKVLRGEAERLAQRLGASPSKLPASCGVAAAVAECGPHHKAVTDACATRISALATVLACEPSEAVDMLLKHPELHAVRDGHIALCLMTLREILPGMDVSKLVRKKVDLLLEDDAMDRARAAVCTIQSKGFDPTLLVESQPLVLLRHDVWFTDSNTACEWDETGAFEHDAP